MSISRSGSCPTVTPCRPRSARPSALFPWSCPMAVRWIAVSGHHSMRSCCGSRQGSRLWSAFLSIRRSSKRCVGNPPVCHGCAKSAPGGDMTTIFTFAYAVLMGTLSVKCKSLYRLGMGVGLIWPCGLPKRHANRSHGQGAKRLCQWRAMQFLGSRLLGADPASAVLRYHAASTEVSVLQQRIGCLRARRFDRSFLPDAVLMRLRHDKEGDQEHEQRQPNGI